MDSAPQSEADRIDDSLIALAASMNQRFEALGEVVVNSAEANRDLGGVLLELTQRLGTLERLVRELARGQCAGSMIQ
jgi:hypothetical protein